VLRDRQALGAHHFAFLRATFQGLDIRSAWRRYLAFADEGPADAQQLSRQRAALLDDLVARALAAARQWPAGHAVHAAARLLAEARRATGPASATAGAGRAEPPSPQARALPSLDEFIDASGLDPDTHSQAEWLALYQEAHGLADPAAPRPATAIAAEAEAEAARLDRQQIADCLRALTVLEPLVVRSAGPDDPLLLWLASPTVDRLLAHGCERLDDLSRLVRDGGAGWWQPVAGLGRARAQAIARWLGDLHQAWGRPWDAGLADPRERAIRRWMGGRTGNTTVATREPATPAGPWPDLLAGTDAVHAGPDGRSSIPASHRPGRPAPARPGPGPGPDNNGNPSDEAGRRMILDWLQTHRNAPHTWRAYRKEAERLCWWCSLVRGKPFAGLNEQDLVDFSRFLATPPSSWVNPTPLPRSDPDWRPFRSGLAASSVGHALRVVRSLMAHASGGQHAAAIAAAAAMAAAPPQRRAPAHTGRHPGPTDPEAVSGRASKTAALPPGIGAGPSARRWALARAVTAGLGLSLQQALGVRVQLDPTLYPTQLMLPGGQHLLPSPELARLIQLHHRDVGVRHRTDRLTPLLCALHRGVRRWVVQDQTVVLEAWPKTGEARAWSWAAVRRCLARVSPAQADGPPRLTD